MKNVQIKLLNLKIKKLSGHVPSNMVLQFCYNQIITCIINETSFFRMSNYTHRYQLPEYENK